MLKVNSRESDVCANKVKENLNSFSVTVWNNF